MAAPAPEELPSLPSSSPGSPEQRAVSPTPSASPSPGLDATPSLDNSTTSTPSDSSGSTSSTRSRHARLSDGATTVVKRRGYMRPQGTAFADSARNRDSVMSLGSIAHMQYYFARTGLLDGKGAQLAKGDKNSVRKPSRTKEKENVDPSSDDLGASSLPLSDGTSSYAVSDAGLELSVVESPTEMTASGPGSAEPPMLPPTVSTYKQKPSYTEPLPDLPVLRRELKEALQDACKVIEESQKQMERGQTADMPDTAPFYEIQGLHILDILTLAIRAAKNYYTAHSDPEKLYRIKPERRIRAELYECLDILKRMAGRNFRGGMRLNELTGIIIWIESIDKLLKQEEAQELAETAERESLVWREGDWTAREREREWLFLKSFDPTETELPRWPETGAEQALPNDFLLALRDGQRLVRLHNALVNRSKRHFDLIKSWHTDVAKPYRMAENLRYWIKAAELRWEIKLTVPVSEIVNGKEDAAAWAQFDGAILKWCQGVRAELMEEWNQEARVGERKSRPPELKVQVEECREEMVLVSNL